MWRRCITLMKKDNLYIYLGLALLGVAIWRRRDIEEIAVDMATKLSRSQFISKYAPAAVQATANTPLFPSVMLAQAILESGDGNSSLSKEARNFFGIKADSLWLTIGGPYVVKSTTEYINGVAVKIDAKFRKYESAVASFRDRNDFLMKNKRYTNAGVFKASTPEAQAQALQNAGYATDPNYANLLIGLINKNNLKQFDTL